MRQYWGFEGPVLSFFCADLKRPLLEISYVLVLGKVSPFFLLVLLFGFCFLLGRKTENL